MPDPLKTPVQTRPTPVKSDTLFYEQVDGPGVDQVRLDYGSDHPNTEQFPNFKLCKEEREGLALAKRWWACEFTLQDTYNYNVDYGEEDIVYPQFTRHYVVLRDRFDARTVLEPLLGIYRTEVTAGGIGYSPANPPDVVLTGGTGSGGELRAVVNESGQVCWLVIINPGNYSVAPTISFTGGDGTGATAECRVQHQEALLIKQRLVEFPDDDPRRSIFVMHECIYESLPGPVVRFESGYEDETGAFWARYRQRVQQGSSLPARGDEYPTMGSGLYVIDAGIQKEAGQSNAGTLHVYVMEPPETRVEVRRGNYPTPSLWTPITGGSPPYASWPIPSAAQGAPTGPYQNRVDGLDSGGSALPNDRDHRGTYENQDPAPASPFTDTISYFIPGGINDPGSLPATFACTSQQSRFFPVGRNTIHGAFTLTFTDSFANEVVLENLRASTPDTYSDGDTVIDADQQQWKGPFYKRIVTTAPFPVLPNQ